MILSIIIVNFNSGYYTSLLLDSIKKNQLPQNDYEIIVIDNASTDNSAQILQSLPFPRFQFIRNERNMGFAAANNIGIRKSKGRYVLLINPDTVLEENVLPRLVNFMEKNPKAGMVTGKLLNPDGSFAIDSRHGIPTPLDAFWKVSGLSHLFPSSRTFNNYHQTFLDKNQPAWVPAISGAFMFIRRTVFDFAGLLDENFFMYCEDIDFCYRSGQYGFKHRYLPDIRILHFKGASSRKSDFTFHKQFSLALRQFYHKYYRNSSHFISDFLIQTGIWLRGVLIWMKHVLSQIKDPVSLNRNQPFVFLTREEKAAVLLQEKFGTACRIVRIKNDHHTPAEAIVGHHWACHTIVFDLSLSWTEIFDIMEATHNSNRAFLFYMSQLGCIIGNGMVQQLK